MASTEASPLVQTGGLGDVLRALPPALTRLGAGVRRFLPACGSIDRSGFAEDGDPFAVPLGPARAPVRFLSRTEPTGVVTTLVACEEMFAREGLYGTSDGDYPDNARRFTLLSRAICERARTAGRPPDVLHVHDWHAALVPLFVRTAAAWTRPPGTVLTIHNMGYQGRFPGEERDWLSLGADAERAVFHAGGIEDHGGINFLKAGLAYADRITAVSPTYAREILTAENGFGLDALARSRATDLVGILNGGDYDVWNPRNDPHLPRRYAADTLQEKAASTRAAREAFRLPASDRPLLGVVGRLAQQKGIDILVEAAPLLIGAGADLVVLGAGERRIVEGLESLRLRHPDRIGVQVGYDDRVAHLVVAGSDCVLVPSRYEPCGLVQMHAMRYGTVPIVHRTGGLADTVRDEAGGRGTGFVFDGLSPEGLAGAVRRALALRASDPAAWRALQRRAMAEDFSWDRAARSYLDLYRRLRTRTRSRNRHRGRPSR
jgi:starch synthase